MKKTLTPTKKKPASTARDGRGTQAKKRRPGVGGLASYTKNFERKDSTWVVLAFFQLTSSTQAEAGPSTAGPSKYNTDEVTFLAAPSDKPLMHELRQMVAGNNVLNESKKS